MVRECPISFVWSIPNYNSKTPTDNPSTCEVYGTLSSVCIRLNRRSMAQHFDYSVIFVFKRRWRPQKVKPMDLTVQTFRGPSKLSHTIPPVWREPFVFKYKDTYITFKPNNFSPLSQNKTKKIVITDPHVYLLFNMHLQAVKWPQDNSSVATLG